MNSVKRSFVIAAALVALSGMAFGAESDLTAPAIGGAADSGTTDTASTADSGNDGSGTSVCTDCFDP